MTEPTTPTGKRLLAAFTFEVLDGVSSADSIVDGESLRDMLLAIEREAVEAFPLATEWRALADQLAPWAKRLRDEFGSALTEDEWAEADAALAAYEEARKS